MKRPTTDRGDQKVNGIWGAKHVTPRMRKTYDRAMMGRSRDAAIRSKCLECTAWNRYEVSACPSTDCPLWPYRQTAETRRAK
jgi:hypothetical protein